MSRVHLLIVLFFFAFLTGTANAQGTMAWDTGFAKPNGRSIEVKGKVTADKGWKIVSVDLDIFVNGTSADSRTLTFNGNGEWYSAKGVWTAVTFGPYNANTPYEVIVRAKMSDGTNIRYIPLHKQVTTGT